jgi:hypothetical protein
MSNSKISALAAATTPVAGTEVLPIVQSSTTKQVSIANLTAGRNVAGLNFFAGSDASNAFFVVGASTSSTGIQAFGKTSATAPGWIVYKSGTADFVGIHAWYKSDFAGTDTYLGGWYSNGDFKLATGNIIQGTAAKGVNFTANTPAAGMTSQLLNWYEEGTYTPTVTAAVGTITTYLILGANYTRIGRQVSVNLYIIITTNGTGAGSVNVTLPFTNGAVPAAGSGREAGLTGKTLQLVVGSSSNTVTIVNYDNTYPGGNGSVLVASMTYFV